ncbi:FAD-dependent oxidoreductase [Patulibacter sp. SYSU D01012]|uniref:FAD-dependent oxidoreductase n=1 Tax=Patulibacter sp. SYSU D01012 TaxID=2817381 RepID=UPI001B30D948|nr:FAD-dependent oxidoreductase [Patulibacter sp. SYSU D01012]
MTVPAVLPHDAAAAPAHTQVLVVGGGTAALEVVMALHERAAGEVRVTLLAPDPHFRYRPLAAYAGLVPDTRQTVAVPPLAAEWGASVVGDRLASVDLDRRVATTTHGGRIAYEALVVASGAAPEAAVPGAVTLGAPHDEPAFAALVARVRAGQATRLAVVVPPGVAWTLPAYEVALLLAHAAPPETTLVTVLTAEDAPLQAFGDAAGDAVRSLLRRRGVELRTSCPPETVAGGTLPVPLGDPVPLDAVVALARPQGPAIPGLPHDRAGFVPVDVRGRIVGEDDAWAVGDVTDRPVKQGGLAVQQADVAAADVLRHLGLQDGETAPARPVVRAALLDGQGTLYLRAEHGDDGWATVVSREPLWWPPTKIAGGRLAAYLAARETALVD